MDTEKIILSGEFGDVTIFVLNYDAENELYKIRAVYDGYYMDYIMSKLYLDVIRNNESEHMYIGAISDIKEAKKNGKSDR